jgi:hypothetical protein
VEAMMPFHELFPEIGLDETRSARVLQHTRSCRPTATASWSSFAWTRNATAGGS